MSQQQNQPQPSGRRGRGGDGFTNNNRNNSWTARQRLQGNRRVPPARGRARPHISPQQTDRLVRDDFRAAHFLRSPVYAPSSPVYVPASPDYAALPVASPLRSLRIRNGGIFDVPLGAMFVPAHHFEPVEAPEVIAEMVEEGGNTRTVAEEEEGGEFMGEVGPADCPICFREMAVPKLLRCGHSFCERCAGRLVRGHAEIDCPTCRVSTEVPFDESLPTNYALKGKEI